MISGLSLVLALLGVILGFLLVIGVLSPNGLDVGAGLLLVSLAVLVASPVIVSRGGG